MSEKSQALIFQESETAIHLAEKLGMTIYADDDFVVVHPLGSVRFATVGEMRAFLLGVDYCQPVGEVGNE